MRSISILGFAAVTACAALVASTAAEAGGARIMRGHPVMGFSHYHSGMSAGFGRRAAFGGGFARPAYAHRGFAQAGFGGGYRHVHRGWRHRGLGYAAGAVLGAAAVGGYEGGYEGGYAEPAVSTGYVAPSYGYAEAPATRSWQRSYLVPQTVVQPVTTTHLEPVTTYRAVQSTQYVPKTVYRQVTQTCSCTTDGVTREVPCAGAGGYTGVTYGGGAIYNRPGLFTSHW